MFEAPSIRLFTEIRRVKDVKGTSPVGGPSPKCAKAVVKSSSALLRMELDTFAIKA